MADQQPTTMYHVAPQSARESIMQHGVDHTRGQSPWTDTPPGNHLYSDLDLAHDYGQSQFPEGYHVYEVNAGGLPLMSSPETPPQQPYEPGSSYSRWVTDQPIPPERLRLLGERQSKVAADDEWYEQPPSKLYHFAPPGSEEHFKREGITPTELPQGVNMLGNGVYFYGYDPSHMHNPSAGELYEIDSRGLEDELRPDFDIDQAWYHPGPIAPERVRRIAQRQSKTAAEFPYQGADPEVPQGYMLTPTENNCYGHAERLNDMNPKLRYTEGWVRNPGKEWGNHAWNVTPEGRVVDPYAEYKWPDERLEYAEHPEDWEQLDPMDPPPWGSFGDPPQRQSKTAAYDPSEYDLQNGSYKGTVDGAGNVRVWPVDNVGAPHHDDVIFRDDFPYEEGPYVDASGEAAHLNDFLVEKGYIWGPDMPPEVRQQVVRQTGLRFPSRRQQESKADQDDPRLASERLAMAERTGDDSIDDLIQGFMGTSDPYDGTTIEQMREPQNAYGRCAETAMAFAQWCQEHGINASSSMANEFEWNPDEFEWTSPTALGYENYNPKDHLGDHVVTYVQGQDGAVYSVDFTAAQYGHTDEFPLVQRMGPQNSWQRQWQSSQHEVDNNQQSLIYTRPLNSTHLDKRSANQRQDGDGDAKHGADAKQGVGDRHLRPVVALPVEIPVVEGLTHKRQPQADSDGDQNQHRVESSKTAALTRNQRLQQIAEHTNEFGPDTSEVVHQFPDNWTIRKHVNPLDLHYEGALMNNCFQLSQADLADIESERRGENPWTDVPKPSGMSYSLRDPDNYPRTSFYQYMRKEDQTPVIDQPLGRFNSNPRPEYVERLRQWMPDARLVSDPPVAADEYGDPNSPEAEDETHDDEYTSSVSNRSNPEFPEFPETEFYGTNRSNLGTNRGTNLSTPSNTHNTKPPAYRNLHSLSPAYENPFEHVLPANLASYWDQRQQAKTTSNTPTSDRPRLSSNKTANYFLPSDSGVIKKAEDIGSLIYNSFDRGPQGTPTTPPQSQKGPGESQRLGSEGPSVFAELQGKSPLTCPACGSSRVSQYGPAGDSRALCAVCFNVFPRPEDPLETQFGLPSAPAPRSSSNHKTPAFDRVSPGAKHFSESLPEHWRQHIAAMSVKDLPPRDRAVYHILRERSTSDDEPGLHPNNRLFPWLMKRFKAGDIKFNPYFESNYMKPWEEALARDGESGDNYNAAHDADYAKEAALSYKPWEETEVPGLAGHPLWPAEGAEMNYDTDLSPNLEWAMSHLKDWYSRKRRDPDFKLNSYNMQGVGNEMKKMQMERAKDYGEVVHRLPNDWTIRKLRNAEEARHEGAVMSNCIGTDYADTVDDGSAHIYSLRDKNNKPHVSIELTHDRQIPDPEGLKTLFPQRFWDRTDPYEASRRLHWMNAYGPDYINNRDWGLSAGDTRALHNTFNKLPVKTSVEQIYAPGNSEPKDAYKAMVKHWFESMPERPSMGNYSVSHYNQLMNGGVNEYGASASPRPYWPGIVRSLYEEGYNPQGVRQTIDWAGQNGATWDLQREALDHAQAYAQTLNLLNTEGNQAGIQAMQQSPTLRTLTELQQAHPENVADQEGHLQWPEGMQWEARVKPHGHLNEFGEPCFCPWGNNQSREASNGRITQAHPHYSTGEDCYCKWGHDLHKRKRAISKIAGEFLDQFAQTKRMRNPKAQEILNYLKRHDFHKNREDWEDDPLKEKWFPWLFKQIAKGNLNYDEALPNYHAGRLQFGAGAQGALTPPRWDEWTNWFNSNHPTRQGKDPMQLTPSEVHGYNDEYQQWLKDRRNIEHRKSGEVVHQFPDGWTIRRLKPDELEGEGNVMGHCVGGYEEETDSGDLDVLSLRDQKGDPHVTHGVRYHDPDYGDYLENGAVYQHTGKNNRAPLPEYNERFKDYYAGRPVSHRPLSEEYRENASRFSEINDIDNLQEWLHTGNDTGLDHLGLPMSGGEVNDPYIDWDDVYESMAPAHWRRDWSRNEADAALEAANRLGHEPQLQATIRQKMDNRMENFDADYDIYHPESGQPMNGYPLSYPHDNELSQEELERHGYPISEEGAQQYTGDYEQYEQEARDEAYENDPDFQLLKYLSDGLPRQWQAKTAGLDWMPGNPGKGLLLNDGSLHTWNGKPFDYPHHIDFYSELTGQPKYQVEAERSFLDNSTPFNIEPNGEIMHTWNQTGQIEPEDMAQIRAQEPVLRPPRGFRRQWQGSVPPGLSEAYIGAVGERRGGGDVDQRAQGLPAEREAPDAERREEDPRHDEEPELAHWSFDDPLKERDGGWQDRHEEEQRDQDPDEGPHLAGPFEVAQPYRSAADEEEHREDDRHRHPTRSHEEDRGHHDVVDEDRPGGPGRQHLGTPREEVPPHGTAPGDRPGPVERPDAPVAASDTRRRDQQVEKRDEAHEGDSPVHLNETTASGDVETDDTAFEGFGVEARVADLGDGLGLPAEVADDPILHAFGEMVDQGTVFSPQVFLD